MYYITSIFNVTLMFSHVWGFSRLPKQICFLVNLLCAQFFFITFAFVWDFKNICVEFVLNC